MKHKKVTIGRPDAYLIAGFLQGMAHSDRASRVLEPFDRSLLNKAGKLIQYILEEQPEFLEHEHEFELLEPDWDKEGT